MHSLPDIHIIICLDDEFRVVHGLHILQKCVDLHMKKIALALKMYSWVTQSCEIGAYAF